MTATFAPPTTRRASATTTALPMFEAGASADVAGTLVAVHFRDERGFCIFSLEQPDGSHSRALGYLPPDITVRAVLRIGGVWSRHAQYGWQVHLPGDAVIVDEASTATYHCWPGCCDRRVRTHA